MNILKYSLSAILLSTGFAGAAIIMTYDAGVAPTAGTSGAADPTTQGWAFNGGGNLFAHGLDSNLGGWRITDGTSTAAAFYDQAISAANVADMNTDGWIATFTTTLNRDAINSGGGGVDNYYNTARQTNNEFWLSYGSTSYRLVHGVDGNGDFTMSVVGGSTYQITTANNQMSEELGAGAPLVNQYVTYTLQYDVGSGQATLSDSLGNNHGVIAAGGALPGGDRVVWGATTGLGQGSTTWNSLTLQSIPEPSSAALLGIGGLALILRRRK